MDTVKIGKFLAELRREQHLTQEQLGEELGVTNKTISRWETGTYLPPVELLQMLSRKYDVSINEILCGERLSEEQYKEKAEETITSALTASAFTVQEKMHYFRKKWLREHAFEIGLAIAVVLAFQVLGLLRDSLFATVGALMALIWSLHARNRLAGYLENHIYGNPQPVPEEKTAGKRGRNSGKSRK